MHRLLIVALLLAYSTAAAQDLPPARAEAALALIDRLKKGEWDKATENFDAAMLKAAPAAEMKKIWEAVTKGVGPLKKVGAARAEKAGKYLRVIVPCDFEKMKLDVRVVFDDE